MSGASPAVTSATKPVRPPLKSRQSTSLPSTPNQRPRDRQSHSRSPADKRNSFNPSPRPLPSDFFPVPPQRRNGGCKYETGMANAKRRVPYSLGPDKLDPDPEVPKAFLSAAEDARLTADMRELYNRLLPSPESEERRKRLVEKLESILRKQWPGYEIKVNVFGSTGNKLGTTDSDVDICITTDCKELEHVCLLADFLANQGMQRVVCVSVAKVPIVKIWDPDLRLACDMNVNNPVALENTNMIRTYVDIDERVRPLAMIIKHWTKRRVLNEAALGGTLSSYTWICMIINFLQTRDPPVLPALQQTPFLQPRFLSGLNVTFDKNINSYKDYGSNNKDSLGVLLFQFFRYYGHELDFETSVVSVRAGKVITKVEKNWHFLQDNRLCVEEPFNTTRNLGNTADDTSVRGIHLELRRAFQMVSEANLARCCAEYEPPSNLVDVPRPLESRNAPVNQTTLAPAASTLGRVGLGGHRGGRQSNQTQRSSNAGRRASSASTRGYAYSQPSPLRSNMTQTELSLQAQQQQYLLHDRLFQQYQFLQAQEQELRLQLHQQAVLQGRMLPTSPYPHFLIPCGAYAGPQEELMRARAGTINQPLTAPVRAQGFSSPTPYGGRTPAYGTTTNPSSPLLHSVLPDSRRSYRRSSFTTGSSGGSLRAQSQPPRAVPSQVSFPGAADRPREHMPEMPYKPRRDPARNSGRAQELMDAVASAQGRLLQTMGTDRGGSEYIGYYLGRSPPLPTYSRSAVGSPFSCNTGLGIQNGGISPQMLAQLSSNSLAISPLPTDVPRSPLGEPEMENRDPMDETPSLAVSSPPSTLSRSSSGPVVVNGSVKRGTERQQSMDGLHGSVNTMNLDASVSDDVAVDTPTSSDDVSQGVSESNIADVEHIVDPNLHSTSKEPSVKPRDLSKSTRRMNSDADFTVAGSESHSSTGSFTVENQPPKTNGTRLASGNAAANAGAPAVEEIQLLTSAFPLSPVKEVRTPSPTRNKQLALAEDSAQMVPKPRVKGKAKQKISTLCSVDYVEERSVPLASQPNGLMSAAQILHPASKIAPVSSWQTQKKRCRHKKASKSETDLKSANSAGGDLLPLDESLRKGG